MYPTTEWLKTEFQRCYGSLCLVHDLEDDSLVELPNSNLTSPSISLPPLLLFLNTAFLGLTTPQPPDLPFLLLSVSLTKLNHRTLSESNKHV